MGREVGSSTEAERVELRTLLTALHDGPTGNKSLAVIETHLGRRTLVIGMSGAEVRMLISALRGDRIAA